MKESTKTLITFFLAGFIAASAMYKGIITDQMLVFWAFLIMYFILAILAGVMLGYDLTEENKQGGK